MWWQIILIILGAIIVLIALSIVIGNITFKREFNKVAKKLLTDKKDTRPKLVTANDIQHLPEPVQRCLANSQIIGKEIIETIRLKQSGVLRMKPGQKKANSKR